MQSIVDGDRKTVDISAFRPGWLAQRPPIKAEYEYAGN